MPLMLLLDKCYQEKLTLYPVKHCSMSKAHVISKANHVCSVSDIVLAVRTALCMKSEG